MEEAATRHNTQQTQETNTHVTGGIRTRNPSNQAPLVRRLRPPRNRDPHLIHSVQVKYVSDIHCGKTIPVLVWTGPEGSRRLRLPDIKTIGT